MHAILRVVYKSSNLFISYTCIFKSWPIIHRGFVNISLAWMDTAVFQHYDHVQVEEIVQHRTSEDAVRD